MTFIAIGIIAIFINNVKKHDLLDSTAIIAPSPIVKSRQLLFFFAK
jgi:hypothetical protein